MIQSNLVNMNSTGPSKKVHIKRNFTLTVARCMGVIISGDFKVVHIKKYFALNVFVLTSFHCSMVAAFYFIFSLFLTGAAVETGGLNRMVSDRDLAVIARDHLTDWGSLVPFLGLTRAQEQQIAKSYPGDYGRQGQECLQIWRKMKGAEATYQALITAAVEAKDQLLADAMKNCYSRQADDTGETSNRTSVF